MHISITNCQLFFAVTSTQPLNSKETICSVHLKLKEILPLRPACLKRGDVACGGTQKEEGIIFEGAISGCLLRPPKICADESSNFLELTQKPARQIDQVNPLIEKLAAACQITHRAPFLLVSGPA